MCRSNKGKRQRRASFFDAPPTPFGRILIHCYSLKPAEMRGFLRGKPIRHLGLDPPGPRRARGVCVYNLTDTEVWPPPPYTLAFNIMPSKKFLTFCLPNCNNKL